MSSVPGTPSTSGAEDRTRYGPRKRRKVIRTRSGCLTCRKRRKLCDQIKPECSACTRLKLDCEWPGTSRSGSRDEPEPAPDAVAAAVETSPASQVGGLNVVAEQTRSIVSIISPSTGCRPSSPFSRNTPSVQPRPSPSHLQDGPVDSSVRTTETPSQPTYALPRADVVPSSGGSADMSLLDTVFGLNEQTLQHWAADCLSLPSAQPLSNPFDALSALLPVELPSAPLASSPTALTNTQHDQLLLEHYRASLTSLVSCTPDDSASAFDAFTALSTASASSSAGQGLHLATLAWAGRHMVNQGQERYEAVSEKFAAQANGMIVTRMGEWKIFGGPWWPENERMTLLAGLLMLMQVKICRGDVWGFDEINSHLKVLCESLYAPNSPGIPANSMPFSFFENLVYHDVLSSIILLSAPVIPYSVLAAYAVPAQDALHTLTGVALPLFCKLHRIANLVRQRRVKTSEGDEWSDEELVDVIGAAEVIEQELKDEKKRMDAVITAKPDLASHRYLHEAYRTASLLHLRTLVLLIPACDLTTRLLVRQSLSLLEAMYEQSLPGWCSSHWAIFATAVCCIKAERPRVETLYEHMIELGFMNSKRTQKIAREVWERNDMGQTAIDWLDIVGEYDWEMYFV